MAFFKNGKYAGQSFETIAAEDRRYSAWALREEREGGQLSRNLAGFVKHVKERHGGVMTIGKHRGQYRQAGHYRYRYRSHPQSPLSIMVGSTPPAFVVDSSVSVFR
jgi:hypothetical protein